MTRDRAEAMAVRASRKTGLPMFISEWHGDWIVSNYRLRSGVPVIEIGVLGPIEQRKDVEQVRFAELVPGRAQGEPWAVAPRSGAADPLQAPAAREQYIGSARDPEIVGIVGARR